MNVGAHTDTTTRREEARHLKEMSEEVARVVNALELCWACQRICECKAWVLDHESRWICTECLRAAL